MKIILALLVLTSFAGVPICLLLAVVWKIRRKPAKKMLKFSGLSLLVLLAASFAFSNFPDEQTPTASNPTTSVEIASNEPENNDNTSNPENVGNNNNVQTIGDDMQFSQVYDFSDGVAWVEFTQAYSGSNNVGLVNKLGQMVWSSDAFLKDSVLVEKSDFKDGLGYCLLRNGDETSYLILDTNGNVTYKRDNEDGKFKILGYGDGVFLAVEHTVDFDSDEWKFGGIDKNGNIVASFKVYEKTPPLGISPVEPPSGEEPDSNLDYKGWLEYHEQLDAYNNYINYNYTPEEIYFNEYALDNNTFVSCEYLGEGVFQINFYNWFLLLNINSQSNIHTYDAQTPRHNYQIQWVITGFENGSATVLCRDSEYNDLICSLKADGSITPDGPFSEQVRLGGEYSDGLVFIPFNQWTDKPTGAYCNLQGEPVIEFSEYNGKHEYSGGPFQNGYALITVEGADGVSYFTVIDKTGQQMFDLKTGYSSVSLSSDGKYISAIEDGKANFVVFDINWNPLITLHDINNRMVDFSAEISDGVVCVSCGLRLGDLKFYVVIDTKTTIGQYYKSADGWTGSYGFTIQ